MAKKQTTINELARIVKQGFSEVKKDIDDLAMATKKEFDQVHQEFDQVHQEFDQVHQEFDQVHQEFDQVH